MSGRIIPLQNVPETWFTPPCWNAVAVIEAEGLLCTVVGEAAGVGGVGSAETADGREQTANRVHVLRDNSA
jgi:hypothetical protein